ncbi:MAG TPA: hypothetical protein VKR32_20360 [Puia sp.]|nr:hypothetical protein [Puia sp.]
MAKKVYDTASLDREIARLKSHAKLLEDKMDESFSYLQDNSSSLMLNTLIGGLFGRESLTGSVLRLFSQSERLQNAIADLAELLINKLAAVLEFVLSKIPTKKD